MQKLKVIFLYIFLFLVVIASPITSLAAVIKSTAPVGSIDDYSLNIFCTELSTTYIKAISGSAVFLSNPDDQLGIIITNAHVARHLLDQKKQCVGRTGSPAATTHKLTLRYIPSYWLDDHNQYIIGDPDQSSTGEFDFALIETNKILKNVKTKTLYNTFRQKLDLKLGDYQPSFYNINSHVLYSYPAQKTFINSIYSPLYRKKESVQISQVFQSPSLRTNDNLLDVVGSTHVDHGSSGGMLIQTGTSNSLIGLSTVLIKDTSPQTVRIVTMRHIFDVLDKELSNINNAQTDPFVVLIKQILSQTKVNQSLYSILKNQKLTAVLEKNTRDTLVRLRIIK